jgi:2-polyprenyl-3-methyl-5-hydroxy-6-metoxy-1,4-benzoquinol methylase/DNA-directed RNA polymerase subunit RPC12/RpoP
MFKCIICGCEKDGVLTAHKPRDRKDLSIVDCPECGHRQLFPLLSEEELEDEYANDKTVRATTGVKIAPGADFAAMKSKFAEWTTVHADMYWEHMQKCKYVLDVGSGYGFLEEELNKREGKKFVIEGIEIGDYRLNNYVGGTVYKVNILKDQIPDMLQGKYDLVIALHTLEHINEPVAFLRRMRLLLSDDGRIIIEVPNLDSFLCELSPEYKEFFYLYEHVSYFTKETLRIALEEAGYHDVIIRSEEIYSLENHMNWMRTGKPFIQYNQMYMSDKRLEFINRIYQEIVGKMGKGYALIAEARV